MPTNGIVIAIDGPASSGKGTVAKNVARTLGYAYIDTGAMYRSVALLAIEQGLAFSNAESISSLATHMDFRFHWNGNELRVEVRTRGEEWNDVTTALRAEEVGRGASDVATIPGVRAALLGLQRNLAAAGGVVMDGRDIGSVVLPNADLKVFLDANIVARAKRRHQELAQRGEMVAYDTVLEEISSRDAQDTQRHAAPLAHAEDAMYLDTTHMSAQMAAERLVTIARKLALELT